MILQCKNCNARYAIPDGAIGSTGRTVRCAKCAHTWFESPLPAQENSTADAAIPNFDEMIGKINETPKPLPEGSNLPVPQIKIPVGMKAMAAMLLIAASAIGLFAYKPDLFGFVPSKGLVLSDVKVARAQDGDKTLVEISGDILNESEDPMVVPKIRVMLVDGENNPLQSWEFKSNGATLNSKETMPFSTSGLNVKFSIAKKFVVDLGSPLELALRRKPQ